MEEKSEIVKNSNIIALFFLVAKLRSGTIHPSQWRDIAIHSGLSIGKIRPDSGHLQGRVQFLRKKRKKFFDLVSFFAGYPAKIWTEQYLSICDLFEGFWGYIGGVIGMKCKKVSF